MSKKKFRTDGGIKGNIPLIPLDFSPVAFCDGGVYLPQDGHNRARMKAAAWFAEDCRFSIIEETIDPLEYKHQLVDISEAWGIRLALDFSPKIIWTDNQDVSQLASVLFPGVDIRWCPRIQNGIADMLTKLKPGKGHIVFNDTRAGRHLIDVVYDS